MRLSKRTYQHEHDEQLMLLVGQQNQRAFEELYSRYGKLMYNYFYRMLWNEKEKSRDFTQELFTKVYQKPHLYDPARPFKTWLYSVAHNMCKNEYAKVEVRKEAQQTLKAEAPGIAAPVAQKEMDRKSFMEQLASVLAQLDEVKRETFELRFVQEMSIMEISEIMRVSEGTVKSRLFYLLKDLSGK
ncbi:MAG: RNA polymerase sigma factor, partial [Flavobacteriales bacterium]